MPQNLAIFAAFSVWEVRNYSVTPVLKMAISW